MPRINLPPKAIRKRVDKRTKRDDEIHRLVYNTTTWRLLRLEYLRHHPLCEPCLAKGRIHSAIDVHHKVAISTGATPMEKRTLGFDYNNLMAVCKECHIKEHTQ